MSKIILPHKCVVCSAVLWWNAVENGDDPRDMNYVYKKGKYYCKGCLN